MNFPHVSVFNGNNSFPCIWLLSVLLCVCVHVFHFVCEIEAFFSFYSKQIVLLLAGCKFSRCKWENDEKFIEIKYNKIKKRKRIEKNTWKSTSYK